MSCRLKYAAAILLITSALSGARADENTFELSCRMSPHDQDQMRQIGYPENALQVMHLSLSQLTHRVEVWETSPDFPDVRKTQYDYTIDGHVARWIVSNDSDGLVSGTLDLDTMVLTSSAPEDTSTWNCSR
jgi:hypothetical protein